jgi:hypothetical protein
MHKTMTHSCTRAHAAAAILASTLCIVSLPLFISVLRGLAARGGQARSTLSAEKLRAVTAQAAKQWQAVLLHLLECDEPPPQPPAAALHAARPLNVQALLQSAGLITVHGRRHAARCSVLEQHAAATIAATSTAAAPSSTNARYGSGGPTSRLHSSEVWCTSD